MIDSSSFPATPSTRIALESVFNALNSFSLLNRVEQLSGLNAWVVHTAAALTPEQRYINRLVFDGLRDALVPEKAMPDFPTYLSHFVPFIVNTGIVATSALATSNRSCCFPDEADRVRKRKELFPFPSLIRMLV